MKAWSARRIVWIVIMALAVLVIYDPALADAKVEDPLSTSDKMVIVSRCVAALETVAWMMDEQGKPTLAEVFREVESDYKALWVDEFPDVDGKPFFADVWDEIRVELLKAKDEGRFDAAWKSLINNIASPCAKNMEYMKESRK